MVKQLHMEMDDEDFENTHPGCIWGVFHAFNYNYWQKSLTKMIPYKKHHIPKYSKGTRRSRARLIAYDSDEMEDLLDVKTSCINDIPKTRKTSSSNKRSLKTHIKSLIAEASPKKGSSTKPRFERTYSIHHLECSDYVLRKVNKVKNQEFDEKFKRSGKNHFSGKFEAEVENNVDVLEIYRVNKDLFSKVLKHSDGGIAKSFCNLESNEAQEKLTRSGSYPSPKLSHIKSFKSSKLDHKQNDKFFSNTRNHSRRTLSLNDSSLEKYAQLLPRSSIEEPKLSSSRSLKLKNECSFKTICSLSRVDYFGTFENEPSCDAHSSDLVVKEELGNNRNIENDSFSNEDLERRDKNVEVEDLSQFVESTNEDDIPEVAEISEEIKDHIYVLEDEKKEEENDSTEVFEEKVLNSSLFLIVQSDLEEDATIPIDFIAPEDLKLENSSPTALQHKCSSKSQIKSYNDFNYVSYILDRSGFSKNDLLDLWYSPDQPLNPSVFHAMEAFWPHGDSSPEDEFCCHHQLLFDLINEALVQIYDTSFTYYPRALSSKCRVPPMPTNFNVLYEVWFKVREIINMKLGSDPTVDDIVARDIWNDDHWMNLQLESECVALDLEDMLLDELLEEILC